MARKISTHTPHTGCDCQQCQLRVQHRNFNSHTPHGVRPPTSTKMQALRTFQLTHPTRGATIFKPFTLAHMIISTHAPHTGCDYETDRPECNDYISTHAPHTGCDRCWRFAEKYAFYISTHTPHTGCDQGLAALDAAERDFNSHTPHGVRQVLSCPQVFR